MIIWSYFRDVPIFANLYERLNLTLGRTHANDLEFRKRTGTLIGNDDTGRTWAGFSVQTYHEDTDFPCVTQINAQIATIAITDTCKAGPRKNHKKEMKSAPLIEMDIVWFK